MSQEPLFGDELRRARREAGLTQDELSERSGVSVRAITDLERGVVDRPRVDTVSLLAEALELSPEQALEWKQLRRSRPSRRDEPNRYRSTLPRVPNQLIGRESTVREIIHLLQDPNVALVNLTGPGGVGKTRVAVEVASELAPEFQSGARFIDLTQVQHPESVLPAISEALELGGGHDRDIASRIVRQLERRSLLLVLDNLEHLLPAAPEIASLLPREGQSKVLVTSRARLQLQAEVEFPLSTFSVPEIDDTISDEYPVIELFEQRARQADPSFTLTEQYVSAVIQICRHLDGLPLAIELAAARVRVMSPDEILPLLQERLTVLADGYRDVPHRHRTMRDAIGWSYDLLEPGEQKMLRELAIFVGGWTIDAASKVCGPDIEPLDGLASLVNNSLIERVDHQNGSRFRMLETIRQFGIEKLRTSGEYESVRERHARYTLELAKQMVPGLLGPDPSDAMDTIEREIPNIRLAHDWAIRKDPEFALELCGAVSWYWLRLRGDTVEARQLITRALTASNQRTPARSRALAGLAWCAHMHYDATAAREATTEALEIAREIEDDWYIAWLLHLHGRIAYFEKQPELATMYAEQSLEIARALNDSWLEGWCYQLLGIARFTAGELEAARPLLETSYRIWRSIDDEFGMAALNALLGVVTRMEGEHQSALRLFQQSLISYRRLGARWFAANFIAEIVALATFLGDTESAARLSGFVEEGWHQTGAGPAPFTNESYHQAKQILVQARNSGDIDDARRRGQRMTIDEAIDEALRVGSSFSGQ